MAASKSCINCGEPVSKNYCPNCGQKVKPNPITWKALFIELSSHWIGTDNRFSRTFIGLTIRPKQVIEEYLSGNRVKYIGPLSYLVLMGFLYVLSFELFGISPLEMFEDTAQFIDGGSSENYDEEEQQFLGTYSITLSKNMRVFVALIVPFLALSLSLFYKKRNYLENFLLAAYISSHVIWLNVIANLIYTFTSNMLLITTTLVTGLYNIWVIAALNPKKSKVWAYTKSTIVWSMGYFGFFIAIALLAFVIIFNP